MLHRYLSEAGVPFPQWMTNSEAARDTIDRAEVVREECGPSQENSRILV